MFSIDWAQIQKCKENESEKGSGLPSQIHFFARTKYGCRWRLKPNIIHLAPLDTKHMDVWRCAISITILCTDLYRIPLLKQCPPSLRRIYMPPVKCTHKTCSSFYNLKQLWFVVRYIENIPRVWGWDRSIPTINNQQLAWGGLPSDEKTVSPRGLLFYLTIIHEHTCIMDSVSYSPLSCEFGFLTKMSQKCLWILQNRGSTDQIPLDSLSGMLTHYKFGNFRECFTFAKLRICEISWK